MITAMVSSRHPVRPCLRTQSVSTSVSYPPSTLFSTTSGRWESIQTACSWPQSQHCHWYCTSISRWGGICPFQGAEKGWKPPSGCVGALPRTLGLTHRVRLRGMHSHPHTSNQRKRMVLLWPSALAKKNTGLPDIVPLPFSHRPSHTFCLLCGPGGHSHQDGGRRRTSPAGRRRMRVSAFLELGKRLRKPSSPMWSYSWRYKYALLCEQWRHSYRTRDCLA
ncbi:hypothetical protein BS47DRAFT_355324 [Hydnum rufescens UP504]|uniref:Uncharacterized protein n=1 Tax=Hydnum rufescens UP504 TaxID=1448309 RepID=A0A9P6DML4_9AGAM|nr:hypothetical protein BS47DRAFT_355324 [Hydnum rufescens UP504]